MSLFIRGEFPSSARSRAAKWLQKQEDIETRFQSHVLGEHIDDITQRDDAVAECAHDPGTGEYLGTLIAEGLSKPQMAAFRLMEGNAIGLHRERWSEVSFHQLDELVPIELEDIQLKGPRGGLVERWVRPQPIEEGEEEGYEPEEDELPF